MAYGEKGIAERKRVEACKLARIQRIRAMWKRFHAAGYGTNRTLQTQAMCMTMVHAMKHPERIPGFRPQNALEAADLSADDDWESTCDPEECQSTIYEVGSREKIEVLAERVQNGEPLFHAEDGQGVSLS